MDINPRTSTAHRSRRKASGLLRQIKNTCRSVGRVPLLGSQLMSHLWPCSAVLECCHSSGLINGFPACPAGSELSPAKDVGRGRWQRGACASVRAVVLIQDRVGALEVPHPAGMYTNAHFLASPARSHVDGISIRGQEWRVISQGSDSQNGASGTLCHSAPVSACPIDPAQLSKPMRDARLRSSRHSLCCQCLWMMYNMRMAFVL